RGDQATVDHFAFSPDGRYLAAASCDAPIFVWDLWHTTEKAGRTDAELRGLWAKLAVVDATTAFRAMCQLSTIPDDAVTLLKANLKPEAPLDSQRLADLADPRFAVRDRAVVELAKVADRHEDTLRR